MPPLDGAPPLPADSPPLAAIEPPLAAPPVCVAPPEPDVPAMGCEPVPEEQPWIKIAPPPSSRATQPRVRTRMVPRLLVCIASSMVQVLRILSALC